MKPLSEFRCSNERCPEHGKKGGQNIFQRGWSGTGKRIRLLQCRYCGKTFSERKGTLLSDHRLPVEKLAAVLDCLASGQGIRQTARQTGVDKNTVARLAQADPGQREAMRRELPPPQK